FFFFQAEDGIRDLIVTGVQTCALPICPDPLPMPFLTGRLRRGQPVADLGDEAFFDKRRMVVRTGTTYLAIDAPTDLSVMIMLGRSEERRVGKECKWGWGREQ